MLKTKRISEIFNLRAFTDEGAYFGDIEECMITGNKIQGWRIKATKSSFLSKVLGGAKGVIIPHQLVKAVDDIVIINKSAIPSYEEEEQE